ncbi:MAG: hypothetical protein LBN39_12620 [Planctomycetaceae bacterium]|jgi:Tfp pilus assembly PilM family ATPase|nr:hypothetical protein [Planctomycetaceae bacterium]
MTRFLAVDWDESELRYLSADVQKGTLNVYKAGTAPLEVPVSEEETAPAAGAVPKLPPLFAALRTLIKEERLDVNAVLLTLDRNKTEILEQTLPPCSEPEIPVLLKNQALRELPHFAEHDPLDFIVLTTAENGERKVLAAGIQLVFRQELVRSFRSLGKAVQGITYRPAAAVELFRYTQFVSDEPEYVLLVNVVRTDVEIITLNGRQIHSVRSFRLPEQSGLTETATVLADEIERTAVIGIEGDETSAIQKVFLFGTEEEWTQLTAVLAEKQLNAAVIEPFAVPGITTSKLLKLPENQGRFAPLLGVLLSRQSAGLPLQTLDLLHPKEPPKPRNYVRPILLAAVLLAIAGYGVYHWNTEVIKGLEAELASVKEEHGKTAAGLQTAAPAYQVLSQVRNWEIMNVPWLDELSELSQVFPREQDLVITRMSFMTGRVGNNPRSAGTIQLAGMVRDPSVLLKLRDDLQSKGIYLVRYPAPAPNPAGGGYPWLFQTTIYRLK